MRLPIIGPSAPDPVVHDLLEAAGANAERAAEHLRELLAEWPERQDLLGAMVDCEHEGDRITHDLIHRMRTGGRELPFDVADGHMLVTALDDVVDHAEQAADALALYAVEAPMEQSVALADVLVAASAQVARALCAFRGDEDLGALLVEVHRLENEGDRVSRAAIASLFANGIDPMVVIRWKDIFASLEAAIDACERVAHVLEGIGLKASAT
jgi:uncharacterized protein Yka (UPF0111/DUF47 family)